MAKQEVVRNYKMSDADLKQECDSLKLLVTRDIADFNKRGVTTATVAAFEQLIDTFGNMPTDEELLGMGTTATEEKDRLRHELEVQIRSIRNIADTKYHGQGFFRRFGFTSLNRLDDNELYRHGNRVHRVGVQLQSDLQADGLTAAMLDNLIGTNKAFDDAIDAQGEAISDRDNSTQDRIIAGNILYAERVRLSGIGKGLYQDTDEARYNDYVIYGADDSDTPPPASA